MLVLVSCLGLTSCNSDDPEDTVTKHSLLKCYALISDKQAPGTSAEFSSPVSINLTVNWSKMTLSMDVSGITVAGGAYPMVTFDDLKFKVDNAGWCIVSTPLAQGTLASGGKVTANDLEFRWLDRIDLGEYLNGYDPATVFSCEIDGRYDVVGSRQPVIVGGSTISTLVSDGSTYTSTRSLYEVSLDPDKHVAKIRIQNANFAEKMPLLNMDFSDIPYTIDASTGVITLSKDNLIPTIGGTPQNNYPVSNVRCTVTPGKTVVLTFDCDVKLSDDAPAVKYNVKADLNYTDYKDALNELA